MQLYNVLDYGVVSNTDKIQTSAIQKVIDLAAEHNGKVYFPAGTYRCATLQLFSNMSLELAKGAVISASRDYSDYRGNGQYNSELGEIVSLLYALDSENLVICGEGIVDCQGDAFAYMDRPVPMPNKKIAFSEMTDEQILDSVVAFTDPRPNQLLYFQNCRKLEIKGITIKDAPCWTVVLNKCKDSKLHDFYIRNDQRLCNSDGIHLCGCENIEIFNNDFICGDDCIALTGIIDWNAYNDGIYIHDCTFSSRSAAIRMGHYASKDKNITVRDIQIKNTNRALLLMAQPQGVLENILIENIELETRIHGGAWWGNAEAAVICNAGGKMKNVSVNNLNGSCENGLFLMGDLSGVSIQDVKLVIHYGKNRPLFDKGIDFQPVSLREKDEKEQVYSLYKENVVGLKTSNIDIKKAENEEFELAEKVIHD